MKKSLINITFSILFLFSCNKNPSNPNNGTNHCDNGNIECSDDGINDYEVDCIIPINTISLTSDNYVLYNVPTDFAGIQFDVDNAIVTAVSGGEVSELGWSLTTSESRVLGFSFSNTAVTNDCGTLLQLFLDSNANGLSNIVFSDIDSNIIEVDYYQD
tara:strand:- start:188 stop:661 length:474 start_codon:yes stop_codon:yes gene_type:complete